MILEKGVPAKQKTLVADWALISSESSLKAILVTSVPPISQPSPQISTLTLLMFFVLNDRKTASCIHATKSVLNPEKDFCGLHKAKK